MFKISAISDQINPDFETSLKLMSKYGFDYVDLHLINGKDIAFLDQDELKQVKDLLKQYKLKVYCIAGEPFLLCKLYDYYKIDSTGFNPVKNTSDFHFKYLRKCIEVYKYFNAKALRTFTFRWPENKKVCGSEEDIIEITNFYKRIADIAEMENVNIVVENCPYSHLPKGIMTNKIINNVNSKYLKLLWDPANSYRCYKEKVPEEYLNISLTDEALSIKDNIGMVHIKDYKYTPGLTKPFVHVALSKGDINFKEIIKVLNDNKVKTVLSIEPEVKTPEEVITSIKALKKLAK